MKAFYYLFTGTILYSALAFYNGYPLITSDTGAYIDHGYQIYLPEDRPLTYSLFLRVFAMKLSLFIPVLIQGLVLAMLTSRVVKAVWGVWPAVGYFYILTIATVFFTSASWYCSQLMPDVFTGVLLLLIWLLYVETNRRNTNLYLGGLILATLMHNSHLLILLMLSVCMLLISYRYKRALVFMSWKIFGTALFTMFIVASIHLVTGNGFTLSKGSHVFLVGKLAENGVLKKYLDRNCDKYSYRLCEYKDKMAPVAWDFVWNENQPVQQLGGWEGTREEFSAILRNIAFSPRYYLMIFSKLFIDTGRQLSQYYVGDGLFPFKENTNPYWKVRQYFEHELPWYLSSKQNTGQLQWDFANRLHLLFLIVTSVLVILYWEKIKQHPHAATFYLLLAVFLISNAFVTANFANVLARLQSRAIWLLPFLNSIYLMQTLLSTTAKDASPSATMPPTPSAP